MVPLARHREVAGDQAIQDYAHKPMGRLVTLVSLDVGVASWRSPFAFESVRKYNVVILH